MLQLEFDIEATMVVSRKGFPAGKGAKPEAWRRHLATMPLLHSSPHGIDPLPISGGQARRLKRTKSTFSNDEIAWLGVPASLRAVLPFWIHHLAQPPRIHQKCAVAWPTMASRALVFDILARYGLIAPHRLIRVPDKVTASESFAPLQTILPLQQWTKIDFFVLLMGRPACRPMIDEWLALHTDAIDLGLCPPRSGGFSDQSLRDTLVLGSRHCPNQSHPFHAVHRALVEVRLPQVIALFESVGIARDPAGIVLGYCGWPNSLVRSHVGGHQDDSGSSSQQ